MFSRSLATLLVLAVSLPISTAVAAYLDVTSPASSDHWYAGNTYKVTWDTSNPPAQISDPQGQVYLGQNGALLDSYELASGFNLADGQANIVPPMVTTGEYQVVLVGNGANHVSASFALIGSPE